MTKSKRKVYRGWMFIDYLPKKTEQNVNSIRFHTPRLGSENERGVKITVEWKEARGK
jgi:hypothetical protein